MGLFKIYKLPLYYIDCYKEDLKDFDKESLEILFEKELKDIMVYIIGDKAFEIITKISIPIQTNYVMTISDEEIELNNQEDNNSFTYIKLKKIIDTKKINIRPAKDIEIKKYIEQNNNEKIKKELLEVKLKGRNFYKEYNSYQKIKQKKRNRH